MDTTESLDIEMIQLKLDTGTLLKPGTTRALIAEVRRLREESNTLANGLERVYELSEDPDGNFAEIRDAISEVADEALVAAGRMLPDGATR